MARLVTVKNLPADCEVAITSDWHSGARAHHSEALDQLVDWLRAKKRRYMGFGGDAVEGKPADHPHLDVDALHRDQIKIEEQFDVVRKKIEPVKDKILWWGLGNHDIYLSRDVHMVKRCITDPLGISHRLGDYQTWVDLGHFRLHSYHGRATMPRGAKDAIQREANQRAWLKNRLEGLAGDCLVHTMGHVHALMVQPPTESYALLCKGDQVRARYFREPIQKVSTRDHNGALDERYFVPPTSRWYVCSGTLRRSGGFGFTDYAEIAGYPPSPIGWAKMIVQAGTVADIEKVIV